MSVLAIMRPRLALIPVSLAPLHARLPWLLASVLLAALSWPGLLSLFRVWEEDSAYAHGSLLLLACMALLLREPPLGRRRPREALVAVLPLAVLGLLWAAAHRAGLITISTSLLPMIWLLLAWSAARGDRHTLLAPGLLLFAVPGWNLFVPALQGLTIVVTELLLSLTGVHALVEGDTVHLPDGRFIIEGGCSGLRFLLAALTIIGFIGLWGRQSLLQLAKWLLLAGLLAVVLNQVRVYAIVLVGYVTEMQHSLVHDHEWFGWVLFLLLFTPFVRLYMLRQERSDKPIDIQLQRRLRTHSVTLALLISVSSLTVGVATVLLAASVQSSLPRLPEQIGEWRRDDLSAQWRSGYVGASREVLTAYRRGAEQVDVQVAGFDIVSGVGGLLEENHSIADGLRWRHAREASVIFDRFDWPLNAAVLVDVSGRQRLALWWYQIDGERHNRGLKARLASWKSVALDGSTGGVMLAFSSPCRNDCSYAAERIDAVLSSLKLTGGR